MEVLRAVTVALLTLWLFICDIVQTVVTALIRVTQVNFSLESLLLVQSSTSVHHIYIY